MSKSYHAKGKLLLTSEYVILHGAKALAVPLKQGQSLSCIKKKEKGVLTWHALHEDKPWFELSIQLSNLEIIQSSSIKKAQHLIKLLESCLKLQPDFINELNKWDVKTTLEFNPNFGFGSSSSLISLLAQWADIDAMDLYFKTSNGSGYDLACASADSAILYQLINGKPVIKPFHFSPPFLDHLWLVYQGKKQKSDESVESYLKKPPPKNSKTSLFSDITEAIISAQTLDEFGILLNTHEKEISKIILQPSIAKRFKNLDGYVKSLGAWGGDFALIASKRSSDYIENYLEENHFDTYYSFDELVIS